MGSMRPSTRDSIVEVECLHAPTAHVLSLEVPSKRETEPKKRRRSDGGGPAAKHDILPTDSTTAAPFVDRHAPHAVTSRRPRESVVSLRPLLLTHRQRVWAMRANPCGCGCPDVRTGSTHPSIPLVVTRYGNCALASGVPRSIDVLHAALSEQTTTRSDPFHSPSHHTHTIPDRPPEPSLQRTSASTLQPTHNNHGT